MYALPAKFWVFLDGLLEGRISSISGLASQHFHDDIEQVSVELLVIIVVPDLTLATMHAECVIAILKDFLIVSWTYSTMVHSDYLSQSHV